jgi:hypothetical protein
MARGLDGLLLATKYTGDDPAQGAELTRRLYPVAAKELGCT